MTASAIRDRILLGCVLLCIAVGAMGSRCNPPRPQCATAMAPCPTGTVLACEKRCAVLAAEGQPCALDPCASAGSLCGETLACAPDPGNAPGSGVCRPGFATCDPSLPLGAAPEADAAHPGNRCLQENVCRSTDRMRCPGAPVLKTPGVCAAPARDGESCDSDWSEARASQGTASPKCTPCAPGLSCSSGQNRTCQRSCSSATDCPCGDGTSQHDYQCAQGRCALCSRLGAACPPGGSLQGAACCDADAVCQGTCCRPAGRSCGANGDCCAGTFCSGNQCTACGGTGQPCCPSGADCQSGNSCQGGTCRVCGTRSGDPCCGGHCPGARDLVCQGMSCATCGDAVGQPCCEGNTCNGAAGLSCQGGSCQACGASGQPCCASSMCAAGLACAFAQCQPPCGGSAQACCAGNRCDGGLACSGGTCSAPCGAAGQPCCAGDHCNPVRNNDVVCSNHQCRPCGYLAGNLCCAGDDCRAAQLLCAPSPVNPTVNVCRRCGYSGDPCCSSGDPCVDGLSCSDGSCP